MKIKTIIIWAGSLGVISVATGALGAHALKPLLTDESLQSFLTGSRYNMYHAIALISMIALSNHISFKWFKVASLCFVIGTCLFSGSIYLLATSSITGLNLNSILGPITPIGGLILIWGWVSIVIGSIQRK